VFERLRQWLIEWPDIPVRSRPVRTMLVDNTPRVRLLPKRLERTRHAR
jgi:hypothetical protein